MGGAGWAKESVKRVVRAMAQPVTTWEQAPQSYRKLLFILGEQAASPAEGHKVNEFNFVTYPTNGWWVVPLP